MVRKGVVGGGAAAGVFALALPFLQDWEGLRLTTYKDIVGVPTVCYGHTGRYAVEGATYTKDKCYQILLEDAQQHYVEMEKCVKVDRVPRSVQASLLELIFNVGATQGCKSTMVKLANAGQYAQACLQLDRWVKAGGNTVKGLVNRRNASEEMCKVDL